MVSLVFQHTGGLSSSPIVMSLLSTFTPRLTCRTGPRMFCITVHVNSNLFIRLVQAVSGQRRTPLPSMPSSQLVFISSCVRPKISLHDPTNSNSYQLVSFKRGHMMMLKEKSTVILHFPRIMFHLCRRHGPADPHQFSDTSNSRRPRDCLFRHLNTALVHPPPSITLSSF